ncbi:DUF4304 domain-containing protein [Phytopseudomonas seleniipraecipitans]|uniref:Uncharacterized protein n=1 Tax=Phytopseudomonas seleniipraecipitans TaxID=640205 RepID=A0A1G7UDA4_9GAMM|nr:DUF4304 domain-containing protein [Pseudomonas seleniipraecipitans]SDG45453.1 protein of unknown function [Pseudomonas seleniipraecipitans]
MTDKIVRSIELAVAPILEQEEFSKNEQGFFRERMQFADYLSIQVKSDNSAVALNAGVQPLFLLSPEQANENALRRLSEVECFIRTRLVLQGMDDYWVSLSQEPQQVADELVILFKKQGVPFFELFDSSEKLIRMLTINDIESGSLPTCFSMMTKSRLALLAAKASLSTGNTSLAKSLAEYGLAVSGMAVSLKREFRDIMARE